MECVLTTFGPGPWFTLLTVRQPFPVLVRNAPLIQPLVLLQSRLMSSHPGLAQWAFPALGTLEVAFPTLGTTLPLTFCFLRSRR